MIPPPIISEAVFYFMSRFHNYNQKRKRGYIVMFIYSFKLNKARVLSGVAAICLALTLVFLIVPELPENAGADVLAENQKEMVDYLDSIGYTVAPQALLVESVVIPEVFNDEYTAYNEKQKPAGFDLEKYAGKSARKYTFKVLNYQDPKTEVVANLLIFENQVIGGDISSTELGGFCNGLITEKK